MKIAGIRTLTQKNICTGEYVRIDGEAVFNDYSIEKVAICQKALCVIVVSKSVSKRIYINKIYSWGESYRCEINNPIKIRKLIFSPAETAKKLSTRVTKAAANIISCRLDLLTV